MHDVEPDASPGLGPEPQPEPALPEPARSEPARSEPARAPPQPARRKEARWGRCMAPWCRGLAMQPVLGSRGPFLLCSAKRGCRFKKELSPAQWRTLPAEWLKYWPASWAGVKPWLRPFRPVASLGASKVRRAPRPRRISRSLAVQASQGVATQDTQEFPPSLSQASDGA
ncbi:unnamed protein product [Effrenium voratum]|nr:unnamed protein product [Effrenium voratum]